MSGAEFTHVGKYMDNEETKERARRMFADPEFQAETARLRNEALNLIAVRRALREAEDGRESAAEEDRR